ncbi:hypothetical protein L1987_85694 [Smallanthus sonchifolius]|uniref:Uncharacterized protein n=1 Tax=Smallanthus sonchifolius TaxID=185202 RepID=A0ACB8XX89_9ASTR|nr:hypothetical protein L1987_85694 [Smallanthus sonchifolius]
MSSQSKNVSVSAPSSTSGLVSHIPPLPSFQKKNDSQHRKTIFAGFSGSRISASPPDTGITPSMAKELKKLREMISGVPSVVQPIPEISATSHRTSRFAPLICDVEIPKRFQTPNMKMYDGTTDTEEHVVQYRERIEINPIPLDLKEACLCKGFGSTLTGLALKWLLNVPPYSITSFAHLINLFNSQFSCSRTFERLTSDLYRVNQNHGESIRDYVNKFGKESLDIPNLDVATAVQALKMGLRKDSQFYEDLVINPCRNHDEVRNRALRFIRLEDDKKIQQRMDTPTSYSQPNWKTETAPFKPYRSKPYSKPDNDRVNAVEDDEEEEEYPKWPRKFEKTTRGKDKSKWCAFHEDFGHNTKNCIVLRKEISYLLSKGYLKEFLGKGKKQVKDHDKMPQRARSPPPDAKVIGFISGGSDICGTSYSAAKRNAKEAKTEKGDRPVRTSSLTEEKVISFNEDDRDNVQDPHHDGLVITCICCESLHSKDTDRWRKLDEHNSTRCLENDGDPGFQNHLQGDLDTRHESGTLDLPPMCQDANSLGSSEDQKAINKMQRIFQAYTPKKKKVRSRKKYGHPRRSQETAESMNNKGSATYQRLVNMIFKYKLGDTMEVYIDDIVVKSKKAEDHPRDLEEALDILDHYNMKLNPSKCRKISRIYDVQRLTSRVAALNRFISRSSKRCKEFYDILKKNKRFECEEKHEQTLQALKEYLSTAPLLMKPEDGKLLSLYLAVSGHSVRAVLVKDHEGPQHPVYYATNNEALIAGLQLAYDMKIRYLQVPREDNAEGDALANLASVLKIPEGTTIPIIHILSPAIEKKNEVSNIEVEEENIRDLEPSQGSWITPIKKYLQDGPYLRCLEDPEALEVLKDIHKGDCGNHTGGGALFSKILRKGYYWPTMRKNAMDYSQKCDACQRHSNILHQPAEPLYPIISSWPFMKWGMDIVGKLPKAPGGKLGIKMITSTLVHPQANGQAESRNKIIINNLKKRLGAKKGKWAEEQPFALWADITTSKNATGQTPFSLMFSIEAMIPTEMNTTNPSDGKLAPKWEGPYLIDSEAGKGAYWLATLEGDILPRSWNAIHLKAYFMKYLQGSRHKTEIGHLSYVKVSYIPSKV